MHPYLYSCNPSAAALQVLYGLGSAHQLPGLHASVVSQVPGTGQDALYITGRASNLGQLLLELRFVRGTPGIDASFKSERQDLAEAVFDVVQRCLS